MLEAGKLRHRLQIQTPVESQNQATGDSEITWTAIGVVWADISPISAREFVASETEVSKVTTRITIRYTQDVKPKMRLYHQAKDIYYNVEGVLSDKESGLEYLTLPCSTGLRGATTQ